jgi:hypothetical protein
MMGEGRCVVGEGGFVWRFCCSALLCSALSCSIGIGMNGWVEGIVGFTYLYSATQAGLFFLFPSLRHAVGITLIFPSLPPGWCICTLFCCMDRLPESLVAGFHAMLVLLLMLMLMLISMLVGKSNAGL